MSYTQIENGVQKQIIECGVIGEKPIDCCVCKVVLTDIEFIGPTHESKFILNENNGIEQILMIGECYSRLDRKFEKLLETMLENELSFVKIKITEDSITTFKVHLVTLDFNGYVFEFTADKKYALALKYKDRGVELFKQNRYIDAFYRFSKACRLLQTCVLEVDDKESTEIDGIKISDIKCLKLILYGNLASCHLKANNFSAVISLCSKVLANDSENIKALYKRGLAYAAVKDFENSEIDLIKFLKFEPNSTLIQQKLKYVRSELLVSHEKFVNMCKRMF